MDRVVESMRPTRHPSRFSQYEYTIGRQREVAWDLLVFKVSLSWVLSNTPTLAASWADWTSAEMTDHIGQME